MSAILSALQLPSFQQEVLNETAGALNRASRLSRLAEQLGAAILQLLFREPSPLLRQRSQAHLGAFLVRKDALVERKASAPREGQQARGTGLGLSVTYGIIQEHAGKIRVESRPGSGTTFYVDFPMSRKAVNV